MINMIKELTRPLLIPMLARCVMTKGKGHLSMAIPFVNNLTTSQGTSYNLRKLLYGITKSSKNRRSSKKNQKSSKSQKLKKSSKSQKVQKSSK